MIALVILAVVAGGIAGGVLTLAYLAGKLPRFRP